VSPYLRFRFQTTENVENSRRALVVVTENFFLHGIGWDETVTMKRPM